MADQEEGPPPRGPGAMPSVIESLKSRIIAGFLNLPYVIICLIGFLAMGLGSIGLFVLFIGQVAIVPLLVNLLRIVTELIDGPRGTKFHIIRDGGMNNVIPGAQEEESNVGPTYWSAHITFFFGYLLANAVAIYRLPEDPLIDKTLIANRKRRARNIIIATVLFALIFPLLRFRYTGGHFFDNTSFITKLLGGVTGGAETLFGILLAVIACGGIGYSWYQFAESCGARAADVFGIAQQMLPSSAKDETPMTCVYSPKP